MLNLDDKTLKLITAAIRSCAYNSYIEGQKYAVAYVVNETPKDHNVAIEDESSKCIKALLELLTGEIKQ